MKLTVRAFFILCLFIILNAHRLVGYFSATSSLDAKVTEKADKLINTNGFRESYFVYDVMISSQEEEVRESENTENNDALSFTKNFLSKVNFLDSNYIHFLSNRVTTLSHKNLFCLSSVRLHLLYQSIRV